MDLPLFGMLPVEVASCPILGIPPFTLLVTGVSEWAGYTRVLNETSTRFTQISWLSPKTEDFYNGGVRRVNSSPPPESKTF